MNDVPIRAVIIGVNVFVTLTIVTLIILSFTYMKQIYNIVDSTDNSIESKFDDIYSKLDGKEVSGLGLINVIKQYEDLDHDIVITYTDSDKIREDKPEDKRETEYLKEIMEESTEYKFEDRYLASVYKDEQDRTIVNFQKIIKST